MNERKLSASALFKEKRLFLSLRCHDVSVIMGAGGVNDILLMSQQTTTNKHIVAISPL